MLQFAPKEGGGPMYAPARDIRYIGPKLLEIVGNRFNNEAWPELMERFGALGTTIDEAAVAYTAMGLSFAECVKDSTESFEDVLRRCGWLDVSPGARIAICAMLGTVFMGALFNGVRDTVYDGKTPLDINSVLSVAERLQGALLRGELSNGNHEGVCAAHADVAR